jgi:hypothetical protein
LAPGKRAGGGGEKNHGERASNLETVDVAVIPVVDVARVVEPRGAPGAGGVVEVGARLKGGSVVAEGQDAGPATAPNDVAPHHRSF